MKSGVYIIRNIVNNKVYIGSTVNITKRFLRHQRELNLGSHKNIYLQRAWNKYGEVAFTFKLYMQCDASELISNEQIVIDKSIRRLGRGHVFNICETAGSTLGVKLTAEHKKKISESRKGKKLSEEAKMKVSKARKGRKLSTEHRIKLSESHKGHRHSTETKKRMSEAHLSLYRGIKQIA